MSYPQETRINNDMDSQVKRLLARAVEFERTKSMFHKMMATLEGIYSDPANRTIEGVEDFIEASKHSVSIGGPKYHDWKIENWLTEQYEED